LLHSPDGEIVVRLIGSTHWGWLHLDLLWLQQGLRGQGWGHPLLRAAKEEARQGGCHDAYLDTFSFQAPEFYRKHGYQVFGELADFPVGHRRTFMRKRLEKKRQEHSPIDMPQDHTILIP